MASVVITSPATSPAFQTVGRTLQFSAEARNATGVPIAGVAITWSSSVGTTATITSGGLLSVAGNGTAEIRATATASGVQSAPVTVTVSQLAAGLEVTPAAVAFGALGSTRQLAAIVRDSGGTAVAGAPAIAWTALGDGQTASVSPTGLVLALGVGVSDTAVATADTLVRMVPISVAQLVASIEVTATGSDTLATTGRTRQYSAIARDSQANVMGATPAWSSTTPAVASVHDGTGLATAVADGNTNIRATVGSIVGQRALVVRRFAESFSLTPPTAAIGAPGGAQGFTAIARDSVDTDLPIAWLSRSTTIATVAPPTGAATTATGVGNGATFIVMSAGTRSDSASLAVSGQASFPATASVTVGDFFFRSARNSTTNAAVDTVAVGGSVTWTWSASAQHNVRSIASPSFASSALRTSGTYSITFAATGDYQYDCQVHPQMTGRVIVR